MSRVVCGQSLAEALLLGPPVNGARAKKALDERTANSQAYLSKKLC